LFIPAKGGFRVPERRYQDFSHTPHGVSSHRVPHGHTCEPETPMTHRDDNRDKRHIPSPRPDEPSAVRGDGMPANAERDLTGIVGDASVTSGQSRSGEDTRRRGWFWHWNSIVTQFAPIIGLKGVGLLNSYTVWTDRREDSRHRGFAFPSQQSESDFYGEDRNELITINKLLVCLDLIEIRKEMVLRTDERGRRWKVPHNLYRVKDHGDEFNLTTRDVMRVAHLADKDRAVYRYVRRIFSAKFAPIDRDNIWHQILEEVRPTDVWQRLAARTERDENRASARSKAGHASRRAPATKGVFSLPESGDTATSEATVAASDNDSTTDNTIDSSISRETSVATTNTGSGTFAAKSNTGLTGNPASIDASVNNGEATSVAPGSSTYYQELTTTTTGESRKKSVKEVPVNELPGMGPGSVTPPDDRRDEDATVRLFDEANSRPTTVAARRHLKRIAEDFANLAQEAGLSGWTLVGSAIDEAVASGSAFVAPKRVREIISRWDRDGVPEMYADTVRGGDRSSSRPSVPVTNSGKTSHRSARDVGFPGGGDPDAIWDATCRALSGSLSRQAVEALREEVTIVGYETGEVMLSVASSELASTIRHEWLDAIQRKLSVALRRPVRIAIVDGGPDDPEPEATKAPVRKKTLKRSTPVGAPPAMPRTIPSFMVQECGMSSAQVWMSVLDDLRGSGAIPKAEVDTWLRDSVLLGRDGESDAFIVGVPHALAERRAVRFLTPIETTTMQIVGFDCEIRIVRTQTWLAAQDDATGTEG